MHNVPIYNIFKVSLSQKINICTPQYSFNSYRVSLYAKLRDLLSQALSGLRPMILYLIAIFLAGLYSVIADDVTACTWKVIVKIDCVLNNSFLLRACACTEAFSILIYGYKKVFFKKTPVCFLVKLSKKGSWYADILRLLIRKL